MKIPKQPDLPHGWERSPHTELATHGIGEGFVLFEEIGQCLRGWCRTFFPTRHGMAVAIELNQPPTAMVYSTNEAGDRTPIKAVGGTVVNLSLSGVDLERKIGKDMRDVEVGIMFSGMVETRSGQMKIYRVLVFQDELPFPSK